MKALWLREVQAVIDRDDFVKWWKSLVGQIERLRDLRERHEELLAQATLTEFRADLTQKNAIDTLYEAGELEDSAAELLAESAEIENKAYEAVANFESQRIAVSELYSQMGAVEHKLLTQQSEIEQIKGQLAAATDADQKKELERQILRKQETASEWDRKLREASSAYERGNQHKMQLWEDVEQMWARSLDINLGVSERRARGRRARKRSEQLFREAEKHKKAAEALAREARETEAGIEEQEEAISLHRTAARAAFDCIVGEDFLYWPRRENDKEAYCMPITDHRSGYNIELEARTLYLIGRQRGVEFIEPLPRDAGGGDQEDDRIDRFFTGPGSSSPEE